MALAKRDMGMKGDTCDCPHHKTFSWIVLIIGILFLFRDLGWWDFWNLQWWTVAFLLVGFAAFCGCCNKGKCF